MYKKITHHIIEEHWDDIGLPMEPVNSWGGTSPEPVSLKRVTATWPITPSTWNYVTSLRNQFNQFNSLLRAYAISALLNSPDTAHTKTELMKVSDEFVTFFDQYYGSGSALTLTSNLKNFATDFVEYVDNVKSNRDVSAIKQNMQQRLISFSDTLTALNPQWWTMNVVTPAVYTDAYCNNVIDQVAFRKAGKWSEDIDAFNFASNIIANGPIYPQPFGGTLDFATIVANSVARQFPSKFN